MLRRWHVESWVLGEEIDGLECYFDDLARHDGEVFGARNVVETWYEDKYSAMNLLRFVMYK